MRGGFWEPTPERVDSLARRFHEAASRADLEMALGDMARLLCAASAAIAISGPDNGATELLIGGEVGRETVALYTEKYAAIDPVSMAVRTLPVGKVDSCHHHIPPAFVEKSEYYQDFLIPNGVRYSSGFLLFDDGREWGRLGVQTSARLGPIEGRRFGALERLAPHVQSAIQQYRFNRAAGVAGRAARALGMLEALDQMGCGAVLTNARAQIVSMNQIAKSHLGVCLRVAGDTLCALDREAGKALHRHIADAGATERFQQRENWLALPRPEGRPVIVRVAPAFEPLALADGEPMVLIKLVDVDARRTLAEACLRAAFGLTGAEARLAMEFAGGQDLDVVAGRLGVAVGTARGQIKRIFMKTDTKGQPELAALLERLAIVEAA